MKNTNFLKLSVCGALILLTASAAIAQKRAAPKPTPKPIVFAVINDGEVIEPIGEIEKGKIVQTTGGDGDEKSLLNFSRSYYKPKTTYNLIFGGAKNGTITIVGSDPKSDCGKNSATVTTQSAKAKLKGFVMALATAEMPPKSASGTRRLPTAIERTAIESLVRAEFAEQGVSTSAAKNLKYYNLTALDIDSDGKAEMVGSYWVETSPKERNLLFFIADKDNRGEYKFGYSEYTKVTPDKLMSGEMKDLDELGGELLLDVFDYDGDAADEIFTVNKAFEGNNFHVYRRQAGKWARVFEGYNYHCAY